jgi:uncharacterized protein YjbI with pentapeptide repeats
MRAAADGQAARTAGGVADLTGASQQPGPRVVRTDFTQANLTRAKLKGLDLAGAILVGAGVGLTLGAD